MTRWGFPLLRMFGFMPQPPAAAPPSVPAVVTPTVANGQGISDTVELTEDEQQALQEAKAPRVVSTATTEAGLEASIIFHPAEPIFKYSVRFGPGYELFNKDRQFRTQDEAVWYVTKVVGVDRQTAASETEHRTGHLDERPTGVPMTDSFPAGDATTPTQPTVPPRTGRLI